MEDAVSLCEWRIENPLETKNISSETNVSPGKNIKDMKITCSSNDYFIQGLFEKIEIKENHTYEIDIVNNVASLVHSTNTTYHSYYNYPLYTMTDKEYIFSKQETIANNSEHVSTSKIHFNRIKGTAIIVYFDYYKDEPTKHLHWEMINAKDCKASDIDDKPKF